MKIVVAPDSFKESLSAAKVAEAIANGIKRVAADTEIIVVPFADGGEGTVEALITATKGTRIETMTLDPLGRPIRSFYGILGDNKTAVIEMAAASGLELLAPEERNPLLTSTFGTGLLVKSVLEAGFTNIILGIGGSATNDGGAGLAQALGFGLLNKSGNPIAQGGGFLNQLHSIDQSTVHPLLAKAKITVACDVRNPLLGPSGATQIYGPQKGATPEMLETLENNLAHYSGILEKTLGQNFSEIPGAGAAGGVGAGLMAFCNAELVPGFDLISRLTKLEDHLKNATLIFTGEGKIDAQTTSGKTIAGMALLARKHQVPLIAFAGSVGGDLQELYRTGVTAAFPIADRPMTLEESKINAAKLLADAAERVMRLFSAPSGLKS